jgi:hypothetical protein
MTDAEFNRAFCARVRAARRAYNMTQADISSVPAG